MISRHTLLVAIYMLATLSFTEGTSVCWFMHHAYGNGAYVIVGDKICKCQVYRGRAKLVKCTGPSPPQVPKPEPEPKKIDYSLPTRQAFRSQFEAEDFTFDLAGRKPTENEGGSIRGVNVGNSPPLFGLGLSYVLFSLKPCGINLPHVHPRASEAIYVITGSRTKPFLRTAFVESNGGRTIVNNLKQGQVAYFPEGLLHYQQNLGCEEIQYIAALSSDDPGISTITFALRSLPNESLQASFGLGQDDIDKLFEGLPGGPAVGHEACLKRCGLKH